MVVLDNLEAELVLEQPCPFRVADRFPGPVIHRHHSVGVDGGIKSGRLGKVVER